MTRQQTSNRSNAAEATTCACGMVLRNPREYHPWAACTLFEACRNGEQVRRNLEAIIEFGRRGGTLDDFDSDRYRQGDTE